MLMQDKTAFVAGVANRRSIAWAIARALDREGARLALGYLGEREKESLDKLVDHLQAAGADGLHGRGLHRLFRNNSRRATQTRERAIDLGVAVEIKEGDTGGRPRQRLYHRDYAPDAIWLQRPS